MNLLHPNPLTDETLTCIANWTNERNSSQTFLMAALDDRFRRTQEDRLRCFLLQKTDSDGFLVAQSSDATCHGGLGSPTDGFQTFQIGKPTRLNSTNLFPKWAAKRASLITVDYTNLYEFSSDRESLSVSTYSYTTKASSLVSRISVMKKVESDETWVKLVTKSVAGCEQSYRCAILHKRTRHIIELELGPPTSVLRAACADTFFVPESTEVVTLLTKDLGVHECTLSGVHNVTSLNLGSHTDLCVLPGFSRVEARCSSDQQVQFIRDCPEDRGAVERANYTCQGGWEESADTLMRPTGASFPFPATSGAIRGFLIARPQKRDSTSLRRVCLMYTVINQTYSWTVGKKGCDRDLSMLAGGHKFTTVPSHECASGGPALIVAQMLVLVLLLFTNFIKR